MAWPIENNAEAGQSLRDAAAKPDPLLADLNDAEIESLAAHLASLR